MISLLSIAAYRQPLPLVNGVWKLEFGFEIVSRVICDKVIIKIGLKFGRPVRT